MNARVAGVVVLLLLVGTGVAAAPEPARASWSYDTGLWGCEVSFHYLGMGNETAWLWTFGDGTNSTERDPAHAYAGCPLRGEWSVSLVVTFADGAASIAPGRVVVDRLPVIVGGLFILALVGILACSRGARRTRRRA